MNHVAAFLLRLVSVACRSRFGHWCDELGCDGPCMFEQGADDYDKPVSTWVFKIMAAGAGGAMFSLGASRLAKLK